MSSVVVKNFSSAEKVSAGFIAFGAIVSIFSIAFFVARIVYISARPWFREGISAENSKESAFFRTQLGAYAACLLFANLLSNSAGVINISWSSQGKIILDDQCKTQAALWQVGDVAAAYFTGAMAVHAFNSLVLMRGVVIWVTSLIIAVGWLVAILLGTTVQTLQQPQFGPFFAPVELYCWISNSYPAAQFGLRYLFIILVSGLSVIVYAVIFLCLRGTLVLKDGVKVRLGDGEHHCSREDFMGSTGYCNFLRTIVRVMLWFPLAYVFLYLPLVISRLSEISGSAVPSTAFGFSATIAQLLGSANVLILFNILRVLAPAFKTPRSDPASESFSTPEPPPKPVIQTEQIRIQTPVVPKPARAFPPPVSRTQSSLGSFRFPAAGTPSENGTRPPSRTSSSPASGFPSHPNSALAQGLPSNHSPAVGPPTNSTRSSLHRHHRSDDTTISYSSNRPLLHKGSNGEFGFHSRTSSEASSATTATAVSIARYGSPFDPFKASVTPKPDPVSSLGSSANYSPASGGLLSHQRSSSDPSLHSTNATPNRYPSASPLRRQLSLMSIVDGMRPSTGTAISPIVEDLGTPNPPFARFASHSADDSRFIARSRQGSDASSHSHMRTPTPMASPLVTHSALVVGDSRYPAFARSSPAVTDYSQQHSAPPLIDQQHREHFSRDQASVRADSYYERRSTSDIESEPYSAISGPRLSDVQYEVAHFTAFPPGAHLTPATIISAHRAAYPITPSPAPSQAQSSRSAQSGWPDPQQTSNVFDRRQTSHSVAELHSPYDRQILEPELPGVDHEQQPENVPMSARPSESEQTPASLPQRSDSLESRGQEIQFTLYRNSQESADDEIILQPSSSFSSLFSDILIKNPRSDVPRTPSLEIRRMSLSATGASHLAVLQKQRTYDGPRSPTASLPVSVQSPEGDSFRHDLQRNHSVIDMYVPKTPKTQPPQPPAKNHSVIDFYLPRSPAAAELGHSPTASHPSEHSTDSLIDAYGGDAEQSPLASSFPLPPAGITRADSLIDLYSRRATKLETLHEVESELMSPIAESIDEHRDSLFSLYKRRTIPEEIEPQLSVNTNIPPVPQIPDGFSYLDRSPATIPPFVLSPLEGRRESKGFADPSPELFDRKRLSSAPEEQHAEDPVIWATLVAKAATGDDFVVRPFSLFQSEFVNSYNDRHVSQLPASLRVGGNQAQTPASAPSTAVSAANIDAQLSSPQSAVTPSRTAPKFGYI